jgi:hypothetical protein
MEINTMKIFKNPNNISIIIENEKERVIDQYIEPITLLYKDDPNKYIEKIVTFFSKYCKDCIIIFYNEKKSLKLIVQILEKMETLKGIIVEQDNKYYLFIKDCLNPNTILLRNNVTSTMDVLYFFRGLLETFDTPYIIHPQ